MIGRVHSIQSLGTVDGPGVRFVVFFQGCPLRCKCCHNPDTWDFEGGKEYTPQQIAEKCARFKEYFGDDGGITLSGGEPLSQVDFATEIFRECKKQGINTCLDTSGIILNDKVKELLNLTDRVLLDVKYTDNTRYIENVGCEINPVLEFLEYLDENQIPTTLRQVIIPSINDDEKDVLALKDIAKAHSCVKRIELLPFRKICQQKYDSMGIDFPFGHIDEPTKENMEKLNNLIK